MNNNLFYFVASLEEDNYVNRNGQNLLESVKGIRERSKQDDSVSRKSSSKSSMENKYSERYKSYYILNLLCFNCTLM